MAMRTFQSEFMRYLDKQGLKYQQKDDHLIRLGFNADNLTVELFLLFDEDNDKYVTIRSYSIGNFPKNGRAKALLVCNEMNLKYKWAKFSLDKDNDIAVQADAMVEIYSVGEYVTELCHRLVNIIDDAYPVFMRARWG